MDTKKNTPIKVIKGFTPDMYLAWLLGQAVPFTDARELANQYKEACDERLQTGNGK